MAQNHPLAKNEPGTFLFFFIAEERPNPKPALRRFPARSTAPPHACCLTGARAR